MKAFHFGLEQALRWRAAQVSIEQARVSAAASKVAAIKTEIEALRAQIRQGAADIAAGSTGSALIGWSAYSGKSLRRIAALTDAAAEAERALAAAMTVLTEADRKLRLLENLKDTQRARWQREFDSELEAFASEVFLGRLQAKSRAGA